MTITKITRLPKNSTLLYDVLDELNDGEYIERRHTKKRGSGQRYRLIKKLITDFED